MSAEPSSHTVHVLLKFAFQSEPAIVSTEKYKFADAVLENLLCQLTQLYWFKSMPQSCNSCMCVKWHGSSKPAELFTIANSCS